MRFSTTPLLVLGALLLPGAAPADVITDWNVTALGLTLSSPPQIEMRTLAMTHVAMFDAVSAVTRGYQPYMNPMPPAPVGASAEAAAAAAAHGVLLSVYPQQKPALDAALQASLAKLPDGEAKSSGSAFGRLVAEQCVAMRSGDGWNGRVAYTPSTGAGSWQPAPPSMGPFASVFWAEVKPFFLKSSTEVTAPGPLAVDSAQYAKELDEVRRLGRRDSTERSADQTAAAIFTLLNGGQMWNAAARAAAAAKGSTMPENARIFAVINMAALDAVIAGWEVKRKVGTWRPVSAIRAAAVNPDPKWEPLINTPPHPDYVSGHSVSSGAWSRSLQLLFGNDGVPFSATFGGALTRHFTSFSQAATEIENARIWAGIHTRTADEHGTALGRRVGELAVQRAMKKID
ncbi:vanadium-dependent haloperoxidase [Roseateles sp. DAIF2]|uniref:vanadium-dependent haloperoxidase n=1 Tax=Roseateles sp. DAIF2 TaxID=2714952 RepID=UPI0018A2C7D8|nr:vanadium-dependent haloperoxidase [Roseateles sp. DAIF2]QPF73137.1 vanadium-dependent haloperoxidase [Roseateles sp. DAIF2]